jgi:hypothetical protein
MIVVLLLPYPRGPPWTSLSLSVSKAAVAWSSNRTGAGEADSLVLPAGEPYPGDERLALLGF